MDADGFVNIDKFQLHFANTLRSLQGTIDNYIDTQTPIIHGKEIFVIECRPANQEIYFENKLYIRRGPSTVSLDTPEAVRYIKERFR